MSLQPKIKGAIFAIISALSLSISMSLAKQLHPDIHTSFVVFIRSCCGFIFFIPFLLKNKDLLKKSKKPSLHYIRIILTFGAMLCTYYAYRNLPIAFATSIGMTSPLFVTILSIFFLREKITYKKLFFLILGYIGVLLVIRPTSHIIDTATIIALAANLLAACCIIIIKILSKDDSTVTIMLYTNIGVLTISFFISIFSSWQALNIKDMAILLCTGFLGVVTQFCSINALKCSTPTLIAPFEYTRIFFASIIGIVIFHEIPNIYIMTGSALIILSTYMITYLSNNNKIS